MKKVIAKINKIIKTKDGYNHHPKDAKIEQQKSKSALTEIELRDR